QISVIRLQIIIRVAERRDRFGLLTQIAVGVENLLDFILFHRFGQRVARGFYAGQRRRLNFQNRPRGFERLAGGLALLVDPADERVPARDGRLFALAQLVFRVGEEFVNRIELAVLFKLLPCPLLLCVAGGGRGEEQTG